MMFAARLLPALALALAAVATGCGGRAHLEDAQGDSFRRAMTAQREAHPRKGVAPATALEIKLATANRLARLSATQGAPGGASTGGYTSSAGQPSTISAASVNLGAPATSGDGAMRLQGK
jgi:hypothetical protein